MSKGRPATSPEQKSSSEKEVLLLAVEAARMGIWDWNIETGELVWSDRCKELFGLPPETRMSYKTFLEAVHPDDRSRIHQDVLAALETHQDYNVEMRSPLPDGGRWWIASTGHTFYAEDGRPLRMVGVARDITERKQAEAALQQSEHNLRLFIEHAPAAIAMFDRSMRYIAVSRRWIADYNLDDAIIIGKSHYEIFPEIPDRWKEIHKRSLAGVTERGEEDLFVRLDGSTDWVRWICLPWYARTGEIGGIIIFSEVITEQKRLEEELREQTKFLKTIHDLNPAGIALASPDGRLIAVNPRYSEITGYSSEELIGRTTVDLGIWPSESERARALEGVDKSGSLRDQETVLFTKTGELRHVTLSVDVIINRHAKCYLHFIQDVTERKQAEEALKKSYDELEERVAKRTEQLSNAYEELRIEVEARKRAEEDWKKLVVATENAAEAIILIDARFRVTYVNPAFTEMTGYARDEIVGMDMKALRTEQEDKGIYLAIRQALSSGQKWRGIYRIRSKDGNTRIQRAHISPVVDRTGVPTHFVIVAHDITDQMRLEERLRQGQKLQAIGTLAGGVAHDFNNILSIILGNAELALEETADEGVKQNAQRIVQASERGRDLVKQILAFSRKTVPVKKNIRLGRLVRETYKLLRASLPSTVRISLDIRTEDDVVLADETQVQQILLNLLTNAVQAMSEAGGKVEVSLSSIFFPPDGMLPDSEMQPGPYLIMTVKDTGKGIPEALLKRIFEPFFTTKEVGRGSGMGLAAAYGITKSHGGAITVDSAVDKGSTFHVYFPKSQGKPAEEKAESVPLSVGGEHILFVDDERPVVEITGKMLESLGYTVTLAPCGEEAFAVFSKDPSRFNLVITDQTMPDLTGLVLARRMLEVRPDLPVIICTGYSETVSAEVAEEAGIQAFAMKPLTKGELARTVRKVLDRRRSTS